MRESELSKREKPNRLPLYIFTVGVLAQTSVNFLGKYASPDLTPLMLSGSRLIIGAGLLLCIGLVLGLRVSASRHTLMLYAVIGLLNMGIPHALLFMGMRTFESEPIDAAIIEAAIPGVILVYIFAGKQRPSFRSCCYLLLIFIGLVAFLGRFNSGSMGGEMTTGHWLLLVSAGVSSIGIMADDKIPWSSIRPSNVTRWSSGLGRSWQKSMFGALFAGICTFVAMPITSQFHLSGIQPESFSLPFASLPGVVALAFFGTCLVWLSIFWLIQLGKLVLVVMLLAVVPIVTFICEIAATYVVSNFPQPYQELTVLQISGGIILLVSLAFLVDAELLGQPESS